ncbi:MAG: aminotransferase class I/II-fold pyridoxal phosphate-dependent enzyme [Alcanivoracaceae bacterium]|nr:aminotransferase class I/II-fold pyridoxal phosphate-dependent enzyme [Alcanivoracaceae bacterium]
MLKLDFNERADSIPQWLNKFSVDVSQLWKYPNRQEVEGLIAKKYNTTAAHVFLSNGGDESIELLFKMCKLNKQSVLLPTPAFSQYTHNLKVWNIDNITIDGLKNLSIDVATIKQNLQANQWLILTRPNNPTGECISDDALIDLIKTAKVQGTNVFLDEAYVEFFLENSPIEYALIFDNVISLRTFSKAYGLAGARLGYLLGSEKLIKQFKQIAMPFNVNNLSLQLVKQALKNTAEMRGYCTKIANNRNEIYTFLQSRNIETCDGKGNFLLFKVKPKVQPLLASFMQKNDIQIKTQVNDLPNWVRITIPENIELLKEVLQTVFKPEILGFDMDGVLLDTSQSYDACISKTVEHFSKTTVSTANIIKLREKGGFNNDWDLSQGLILQAGFKVKFDDIVAKFQQYYNGDGNIKGLKQNEISLISKQNINIYFNNSYTTAIITGRPRAEAITGVKQLNIKTDYIISADDVSEQKPSPPGINRLKSNSNKTRMWFCGDTVDDMHAGQASNCVCIGIGENAENLYAAGADIVLNNINELEELL